MKLLVATFIFVLLAGATGHLFYSDLVRAQDVLQSPGDFEYGDEPSEEQIREILIEESITHYKRYYGRCPCPYSILWNKGDEYLSMDREGRWVTRKRKRDVTCGDKSEYVRPDGQALICYPSDVPAEMIELYRKNFKSNFPTEPPTKF